MFKEEQPSLKLKIAEVEKTFVQVVIDLKEILVLDRIDTFEDPYGFRILSHDLYGPLPEILITDTGDRYPVLDRIANEAAKLYAIVRVRKDLSEIFPGCEFLLPTRSDEKALVGIRFDDRTILAEGPSYWETYHELLWESVRELL
jgi:hypothetical protein